MHKTIAYKFIIILAFINTGDIHAQITKSCFSLKLNVGATFTSKTASNNTSFSCKNVSSISEGLSYNIALRKKSILELGLLYYSYGGSIKSNLGGFEYGFSSRLHIISAQIFYHTQLFKNSTKSYLGLGLMYINQGVVGLSYSDSFKRMSIQSVSGSKLLTCLNYKYFINIRSRVISLDIIYTKGFNNLLEIRGTDRIAQTENFYYNKGSGIHLGVSYYFRKHR